MTKKRQPDYFLNVPVGEGDNAFWYRAGAAWKLKDGLISIKLEMIPVKGWNGNLMLVPNPAKTKTSFDLKDPLIPEDRIDSKDSIPEELRDEKDQEPV